MRWLVRPFGIGCLMGLLLALPQIAHAGGYRSSCYSCYRPTYYAPKVVTQTVIKKQVDLVVTPTFVSFVPSQVLLSGQVTTYATQAAGAVGYSYQGVATPAQATAAYQQPMPQQQAMPQQYPPQQPPPQATPQQIQQQSQPADRPLSESERLDRMERNVELILNALGQQAGVTATALVGHGTLSKNCASCHTAGGANEKALAKLVMFDEGGKLLPELPRYAIYEAVDAGTMPPAGKLPDPDREDIRQWLMDGLKNQKPAF